jgi:hypothetical protein
MVGEAPPCAVLCPGGDELALVVEWAGGKGECSVGGASLELVGCEVFEPGRVAGRFVFAGAGSLLGKAVLATGLLGRWQRGERGRRGGGAAPAHVRGEGVPPRLLSRSGGFRGSCEDGSALLLPAGSPGVGVDAVAELGAFGGDALAYGGVDGAACFLEHLWRHVVGVCGGSPVAVLVDVSETVSGKGA